MVVKVRVSKVGRPYKAPDIQQAIQDALDEEAKEVLKDYDRTTATWTRKPTFKVRQASLQAIDIFTDNEIYGYVNDGTKPHVIRAKNAPTLAFNTVGFQPKTKVGRLTAKAGSKAKPPKAFPVQVNHPGTKGRDFDELITKRVDRRFPKRLQKHLNSAYRKRR